LLISGIIVALVHQAESIFNEVAEEYKDKIKFVKLSVLETPANRELAIRHGIMSTPTLMFFWEGRPVGQALGFMPKEHLKKLIDDMLERALQRL